MSESTDPFEQCYLDAEETDYLLPLKEEEIPTLKAAVGMWECRMLEEEDTEAKIMMNMLYNRLDDYADGLKEA